MQSFKALAPPPTNSDMYCHSPFYLRGYDSARNQTRFADIGELEQPAAGFHQDDAVDLSRSSIYNNLQFGGLGENIGSDDMILPKGAGMVVEVVLRGIMGILRIGEILEWENIANRLTLPRMWTLMIETSPIGVQHGALVVDSMDQSKGRMGDQKALRRLAQNREAARKSRLRKKAYVQQLEHSRMKLTQLEQELQRARQQGIFIATGVSGDQSLSIGTNGALAFDMDYARWLEEHQRLINDLRSAVNSHIGDTELRVLVDGVMSHYDEIFRLKGIGAKSDVFHLLSGMWKTPTERCFMWLGGFRSSELLKILENQLEPLTDQQLMGICNLQQSSQQAEDALSQGMEALQQSLADLLRQQTLQQMHRILTTRQAARALLVISDYATRLRALSSLWLARPKD
ncbi:bZIP transcription factor family protein [Actinidia rufa]|uniref:BZIP transcription factor family protein n=1 Tax=Actinidia rufa TaxID=165716 RepID=A0A7J0GZA9_9ERIC|nr:bZIP transcription factor family protein [Actinidia rufa]